MPMKFMKHFELNSHNYLLSMNI